MTPAAIIALIKDAVILIAAGLAIFMLVNYGKDIVKVKDMQAVQKQIDENAQTGARWQKEQSDANAKRDADLAKVTSTINNQHAPIIVRVPIGARPVPGASSKTSGAPTGSGGTDQGRGIDYRPIINAFELKYETALSDCRAAIDGWPQ